MIIKSRIIPDNRCSVIHVLSRYGRAFVYISAILQHLAHVCFFVMLFLCLDVRLCDRERQNDMKVLLNPLPAPPDPLSARAQRPV